MPYHHKVSTHHRAKRAKKVKRLTLALLLVVLLFAGIVGGDWLISQLRGQQSLVSVESTATVRSSNINIFRTPFFQFQTDRSWSEITSESTDDKFVYRSLDGLIVQHELIVEINRGTTVVLDNERTSRVMPVEIIDSKLQPVADISPHCRELTAEENDRNQQFVEYENTTFPCNPDSSSFVVVVGQSGSEHFVEKPTFDGVRTYKITYRDSTFTPAGRPLSSIIRTFQLL